MLIRTDFFFIRVATYTPGNQITQFALRSILFYKFLNIAICFETGRFIWNNRRMQQNILSEQCLNKIYLRRIFTYILNNCICIIVYTLYFGNIITVRNLYPFMINTQIVHLRTFIFDLSHCTYNKMIAIFSFFKVKFIRAFC